MPDFDYREDQNKFEDDSPNVVKSLTLKEYGRFLNRYSERLSSFGDGMRNDVWDINTNPIFLQTEAEEELVLEDLMVSGSATYNKITATLCDLCARMQHLSRHALHTFYTPLIFYGEADEKEDEQMEISRFLTLLKDIHSFVETSASVIRNLLQQLSIIYSNQNSPVKAFDFSSSKFTAIYEEVGALMRTLAYLDHLVANQSTLKEHWKLYKRMLKNIRTSPETFGMDGDEVGEFVRGVEMVEVVVMGSRMFQTCFTTTYDDDLSQTYVCRNAHLAREWLSACKNLFADFEAKTAGAVELEWDRGDELVGLVCMSIFHQTVFHKPRLDKKFFKNLWDVHKRFPAVLIGGMVCLHHTDLLSLHLPNIITPLISFKGIQATSSLRSAWMHKNIASLPSWTQAMEDTVTAWMVEMESCSSSSYSSSSIINSGLINNRLRTFIQGLSISSRVRNQVCILLNLHASSNTPLSKTSVLLLCRLVEVIKVIEASFFRLSIPLQQTLSLASHLLSSSLATVVANLNARQQSNRKADKETNAGIQLLTQALNGPVSQSRLVLMRLNLDVLIKHKVLKDEEQQRMVTNLRSLHIVKHFNYILKESCDCGFLCLHRVLLPSYFSNLIKSPIQAFRLQSLLSALNDVSVHLATTKHTKDSVQVVQNFEAFVLSILNETFLDGVCRVVETELRLDSHHHLQLNSRNPFKTQSSQQVGHLLHAPPLRLFQQYVSVKRYVENYLNKTFYNLTTVALHDWKTYTEMRVRAAMKFQLDLIDPHLPSQTLEQGLDILEIMRNINVFVSRYLYNLNNQIFVERCSNNKHLNTITISHVANSIRTHGSGISNTTVNFAYQFLKKQFAIFSQFLYDEHIKSKLIKDVRYFKENQESLNFKYPYDRAERFNKGIRKLGLREDGLSYLDKFRELISHIGNAMGYIRLIRSGGQHCCGNSIRFVANIDDVSSNNKFEEMGRKDELSDECCRAARHLDDVISNLSRNFAEGADYFKVLVDVFSTEFQDSKNLHLKYFYVILPPLTLNYVEHITNSKEKLNKKNKTGAAFTDDGFAMGVAYILKLLNQHKQFDALHWFHCVKEKLQAEKEGIMKQRKADKEDEKLIQAMSLTLKKVQVLQQEFNLLYFSLSSARIFFRADEDDKEETNADSIKEEVFPSTATA